MTMPNRQTREPCRGGAPGPIEIEVGDTCDLGTPGDGTPACPAVALHRGGI